MYRHTVLSLCIIWPVGLRRSLCFRKLRDRLWADEETEFLADDNDRDDGYNDLSDDSNGTPGYSTLS